MIGMEWPAQGIGAGKKGGGGWESKTEKRLKHKLCVFRESLETK